MIDEFKILLLGDYISGKTTFSDKLIKREFFEHTQPTIASTFFESSVNLKNGHEVILHIWDTIGTSQLLKQNEIFYKGAHGVILFYDITRRGSFEIIEEYFIESLKKQFIKMPAIYLIGNKKDLEKRGGISEKEGKELAEKEGFLFKEISVKTDTVGTLNEILQELAEKINKNFHN